MIAAVVLAAGLGTRMGTSKPLLDIDGRPSLARVLDAIDAAEIDDVIVVLGRDADRIAAEVDLRTRRLVVNGLPERGLASSLALGLEAVPEPCVGALVLHADMPFVRASTVRAVAALGASGAEIAAPRVGAVRGFPVYFARSCFPGLAASLAGDEGGRRYVERRRDALRLVDVADPGCIRDVDRPEDLVAAEGRSSWTTFA